MKTVGIYPHIFRIEEEEGGMKKQHSLQYGDVISGVVTISEM